MYDDLIKRLRELPPEAYTFEIMGAMHEAADAIEELQAQLMYSNDAAKAIAEKVPKWIPVTERLPELYQKVLVYAVGKIDGFIGSSVYALTERFLFKIFPSSKGTEEWRSPWLYFMKDYEITHWMPLSEPPKEE